MQKELTKEDYVRLELVTKGESLRHRHWPPEVVRALAGGEAVTATDEKRGAVWHGAGRRLEGIRARLRASRLNGHPAAAAVHTLNAYEGEI